jgi:hypothetical protein
MLFRDVVPLYGKNYRIIIIIITIIIINLRTAAFEAYCAIWVRR